MEKRSDSKKQKPTKWKRLLVSEKKKRYSKKKFCCVGKWMRLTKAMAIFLGKIHKFGKKFKALFCFLCFCFPLSPSLFVVARGYAREHDPSCHTFFMALFYLSASDDSRRETVSPSGDQDTQSNRIDKENADDEVSVFFCGPDDGAAPSLLPFGAIF